MYMSKTLIAAFFAVVYLITPFYFSFKNILPFLIDLTQSLKIDFNSDKKSSYHLLNTQDSSSDCFKCFVDIILFDFSLAPL